MAETVPISMLGLQVSGDLGGLTIYTDRFGKKIFFPKSPPKEPASYMQMIQRFTFADAQELWSELSDDEKLNLEDATKRTSAPLTGQNLFISAYMRDDDSDFVTFARQANIELPTVPKRKRIFRCEIDPVIIVTDGNKIRTVRARVVTNEEPCNRIINLAIRPPYPGNFVGTAKNNWSWNPVRMDYFNTVGFSVHDVVFKVSVTIQCKFEVTIGQKVIF